MRNILRRRKPKIDFRPKRSIFKKLLLGIKSFPRIKIPSKDTQPRETMFKKWEVGVKSRSRGFIPRGSILGRLIYRKKGEFKEEKPKKRVFRKLKFGFFKGATAEYSKMVSDFVHEEEKKLGLVKKEEKTAPKETAHPSSTYKGHYMKRNVNFSLFFLITIILAALIGLTAYYQTTYAQQENELNRKTSEFNTALHELSIKKTLLNQTSVKLEVEQESKEQLGSLYTTIKQEKEAVEADLAKTKETLLSTMSQLESTKSKLITTEQERDRALKDVTRYREEAEEWKADAESCSSSLNSCREALSKCGATG